MITEDDERWARYVAVPALVVSLPLYAAFAVTYVLARESFASMVEFIDCCRFLPDVTDVDEDVA